MQTDLLKAIFLKGIPLDLTDFKIKKFLIYIENAKPTKESF